MGWGDTTLYARLPYLRFDAVMSRARREVLREFPECARIPVLAGGAEAPSPNAWGEFYPPVGPIIIYQLAYETMGDQENYYRQIKDVLRHEYRHAIGRGDHETPNLAHIATGQGSGVHRLTVGNVSVTFPP